MTDVHDWVSREVWRILRSYKRASVHDIEQELVPPSNSLADLQMRTSGHRVIEAWCMMLRRDRQVMVREIVAELLELHRLSMKETEKFSRYRSLSEVEVLDSLSRIF